MRLGHRSNVPLVRKVRIGKYITLALRDAANISYAVNAILRSSIKKIDWLINY
jgi:phosphoribosylformylglycinamidine (FGAM) synthase PurS component